MGLNVASDKFCAQVSNQDICLFLEARLKMGPLK